MAEVQVQDLADLGVEPLHVLDAVVGELPDYEQSSRTLQPSTNPQMGASIEHREQQTANV